MCFLKIDLVIKALLKGTTFRYIFVPPTNLGFIHQKNILRHVYTLPLLIKTTPKWQYSISRYTAARTLNTTMFWLALTLMITLMLMHSMQPVMHYITTRAILSLCFKIMSAYQISILVSHRYHRNSGTT